MMGGGALRWSTCVATFMRWRLVEREHANDPCLKSVRDEWGHDASG